VFEERDDVRVLEFAEHAGFAGETFFKRRITAQFGREDFEGDRAVEFRLARLIDVAHAAVADEPDDFTRRPFTAPELNPS
jgi:hypothetical protein